MSDDTVLLRHILDSIDRIYTYTSNGETPFFHDQKTQDAVIRNLETIGEAAKHLPDELKSRYPEIPWKPISGMRDRLIHQYFSVNLQLVWEVVVKDLPALKREIEDILIQQGGS
jgi:uncharacterized protein with HEPN domain